MFKKIIHILLILSGILVLLVPITGIIIHKMASVFFLVFSIIHILLELKRLNWKKLLFFILLILVFISGVLAFMEIEIFISIHKILSIIYFMLVSVHIFIHKKKI